VRQDSTQHRSTRKAAPVRPGAASSHLGLFGICSGTLGIAMGIGIHASSKSAEWESPPEIFREYDKDYHFTLDVCANAKNALCKTFFDKSMDGLSQDWGTHVCWMNPPYGREIGKWVRKAFESAKAGATVVCFLPARTDTRWWHEYVMRGEIRFLRGRFKLQNRAFPSYRDDLSHKTSPAPFPCAMVVFRPMSA